MSRRQVKGKAPAAEPTAPPPSPAIPAPQVTRVIQLDPEDWHRATWRWHQVLTSSRPRQVLTRPSEVPRVATYPPCAGLSRKLWRDDVTAEDILTALESPGIGKSDWQAPTIVFEWAARHLFPYLSDQVLGELRDLLRPRIDPSQWPTDYYARPAMRFFLAALCGLHAEVLSVVTSWPDDRYGRQHWDDYYHMPQQMVFGLGDAQLVDQQMRRLKLRLHKPTHIRAWLAHTELDRLDYVRDCIQKETNKLDARTLLGTFTLVKAPEAAEHMLDLKLTSKAPMVARAWLDENVGNAIAGLIPVAAGRGRLADAALDYLRKAHSEGHASFIEEQLAASPPEAARRVRQEVLENAAAAIPPLDDATTPAPLRKVFQSAGKLRPLPDWVSLTSLPPLRLGDRRLNDEQVQLLLCALRDSPLSTPSPVVAAIKEQVEPASRDAFAWKLFELWLGEGAPNKEKWALLAVGHLGGDASVLKLTPLLRAWPGESQHQRAVTGLECLRAIGSDTALMQLNGIAQKLKFQGLKKKAQEFMEQIATDKGLSRAQLEDRIVPDLDLDEKGGRTFDFGPRQFTLALDADLKPLVRDDTGKLKADLPKPGARDDADKSRAAVAEWKLLKKQLREVLKVQVVRLEQAMVSSRRWPVQEFERLLVRHPLMINLVRRLLWGGYDAKGKFLRAFRVTEESEYADVHDNACTLEGLSSVGLVHPLHLSEEERASWGQLFGDYEIIAPFPQLGRRVHTLQPGEEQQTEITRFSGPKVPALTLVGILEKLGWSRGVPQDAGVVHEHYKPFPGAEVTAVIEYANGVPMGYLEGWEDQQIENAFFVPGADSQPGWFNRKQALRLGQVDPVVLSEVLGALAVLASKGQ
jgi:hypothetical protein